MLLVFLLAAGIWGLGAWRGVPAQARWLMIGLLFVAVVAVHVILPDGHPMRMALGETAQVWMGLAVAVGIGLAYVQGLRLLRKEAEVREAERTVDEGPSEVELDRYARHIILREIGGAGQMRLRSARVLVIGAGGLGAPVLLYLSAAGVGTLGVIDDDAVELANLQRQVIHDDARLGMPKVFSAEQSMERLNPHITVRPYNRRLTEDIAADLFDDYDLVIDGTDNFDTRYLANRAAVAAKIPLISGALSQWEGQVSVFDPSRGAPCYACVFPQAPADGLAPSCAEAGVVGPLPGVVGSMIAVEAIKLLTGAGQPLLGQMLIYDALYGENRMVRVSPRKGCPVCGGGG